MKILFLLSFLFFSVSAQADTVKVAKERAEYFLNEAAKKRKLILDNGGIVCYSDSR